MSSHGSSADADTQPGKSKTVADILTEAAAIVETPGAWGKGGYGYCGEDRCRCVTGVIGVVQGRFPDELSDPAIVMLAETVGVQGYEILTWNDAPERTQAEVVAALRQAAEKARQAVSS